MGSLRPPLLSAVGGPRGPRPVMSAPTATHVPVNVTLFGSMMGLCRGNQVSKHPYRRQKRRGQRGRRPCEDAAEAGQTRPQPGGPGAPGSWERPEGCPSGAFGGSQPRLPLISGSGLQVGRALVFRCFKPRVGFLVAATPGRAHAASPRLSGCGFLPLLRGSPCCPPSAAPAQAPRPLPRAALWSPMGPQGLTS